MLERLSTRFTKRVDCRSNAGEKGHPGVDALGSAIAVAAVHDVAFKAGENVLVENRDGILLYFSAIEGLRFCLKTGLMYSMSSRSR